MVAHMACLSSISLFIPQNKLSMNLGEPILEISNLFVYIFIYRCVHCEHSVYVHAVLCFFIISYGLSDEKLLRDVN